MRIKHLIGLILICWIPFHLSAQNEPTIATCDGEQTLCLDDNNFELCVTITVDSGLPSAIDHFEIDWDDGSEPTIVAGSQNPADQSHSFDFSSFYNTCTDDIRHSIFLLTYLDDGTILNNGFIATFLNPPISSFALTPSVICVGEEVCFNDNSCPSENTTVLSYNYGDGSSGEENCRIYNQVGTYQITQTVENPCGTHTSTQTLEVIEAPIANAIVQSGFVEENDGVYTVCLGSRLELDGTMSQNAGFYEWDSNASNNQHDWIFEPQTNDQTPNMPEVELIFLQAGMYEVTLTVNNACDNPDEMTLFFEVINANAFMLNEQEDACMTLEYTPDPYDEDAVVTYCINGMEVSNFPITLNAGTYAIKASNPSNLCSSNVLTDTFTIASMQSAVISTPDTTLCSTDAPLTIMASPENANWFLNGNPFDGVLDPNASDVLEGDNIVTYSQEPCIAEDRIVVHVIKTDVETPSFPTFCVGDGTTNFSDSFDGGTFSGMGITDTILGTFDPSVAGEGTHTIDYEVSDPNLQSCTSTTSFEVTVIDLAVDFEIESCDELTLNFVTINTSDYDRIEWDFGDNSTSSADEPTHTFATADTYTIMVTIHREDCEISISRPIVIESTPVAAFDLVYDNLGCSTLEVGIVNNSIGNNLIQEWDYGDGETFEGSDPPPHFYDAIDRDTTYTISLIIRSACSDATYEEDIFVRARAIALFGTTFNSYCSGEDIPMSNNATGSPDSYEWYKDGTLISTDSMPPMVSHLTDELDTIELCLIVENLCGKDTLCRLIEIRPTEVHAFFNTDTNEPCVGATICFTNFSNSTDVVYDFGDGTTSTELNPCHTYNNAGTYEVTLRAFGCGFDVTSSTLEIKAIPEFSLEYPLFSCPGASIPFEAIVHEDMDEVGFLWDFGDSITSSLSHPIHTYDTSGVFDVCLTVTSLNGCEKMLCQTITVQSPPTALFSFMDSICVGEIVQITNMTEGDITSCFYDFGEGNFSNECHPSPIFNEAGSFEIMMVVENNNGCLDTLFQPIFIRAVPQADFSFTFLESCQPAIVQFDNLSLNAESYEWDFGDGGTSTETHPTHSYEDAGTYRVTLKAWKDGICMAEINQNIEVFMPIVADLTISQEVICATDRVTFSTSPEEETTVFWDFGDGMVSFENSEEHIYTEAGLYQGFLIKTSPNCADTTAFEIQVNEQLDFDINIEELMCFGDNNGRITLIENSGTAPFEFSWEGGISDSTRSALSPGTYPITVSDQNGCRWIESITMTEPDRITSSIENLQIVTCYGGTDGALEVQINGGVPDYQLLWSNNATSPTLNNLSQGVYQLSVTDANNCMVSFDVEIPENPLIEPTLNLEDFICFGANNGQIIVENVAGGVPAYTHTLTGNNYHESGERFSELMPDIYILKIEDALGCTEEFEVPIIEQDSIWVDIKTSQDSILLGQSVDVQALSNISNPIIEWWTTDDNFDCDNCLSTTTYPDLTSFYQVHLLDENNCAVSDTAKVVVKIEKNIFVPNAFTPNNDAVNNILMVRNDLPSLEQIGYFRIFDRWGELIFEQTDFQPNLPVHGWDGTFKGEALPPGQYIYTVRADYIDKTREEKHGKVLLIR